MANIILAMAVTGIGSGLFQTPNNSALMNNVPPEHRGVASGMLATARNIGMVLWRRDIRSVIYMAGRMDRQPVCRIGLGVYTGRTGGLYPRDACDLYCRGCYRAGGHGRFVYEGQSQNGGHAGNRIRREMSGEERRQIVNAACWKKVDIDWHPCKKSRGLACRLFSVICCDVLVLDEF